MSMHFAGMHCGAYVSSSVWSLSPHHSLVDGQQSRHAQDEVAPLGNQALRAVLAANSSSDHASVRAIVSQRWRHAIASKRNRDALAASAASSVATDPRCGGKQFGLNELLVCECVTVIDHNSSTRQ